MKGEQMEKNEFDERITRLEEELRNLKRSLQTKRIITDPWAYTTCHIDIPQLKDRQDMLMDYLKVQVYREPAKSWLGPKEQDKK